ncbi:spermine oxidase-like [Anopheles cruzii]|uniref:spermine oxidase-like n=1 Tax=Anopheles cruzii TaxID=68878 RepID=UPI0022EC2F9B|nr:spermine oxidase-like [Anopheles cruzii]
MVAASLSGTSAATNPRIVIIGAGASGIAAATTLYRAGLTNITVLEASHRIGGRVNSVPFGGDDSPVELGAQWCHGEEGNVAYQMASAFPGLLKTSMIVEEEFLVQSDGTQVPETISDRLWALSESILEASYTADYAGSLGDYITTQYRAEINSPQYSDINRELAEQFLVSFHNSERGRRAIDSWFDVATSSDDDYEVTEGEQALAWTGKRGFSSILDILTGTFPGSTSSVVPINTLTSFNKVVNGIHWEGTTDDLVTVATEDGSRYSADHVIVTVSLGVLKADSRTMFTPALPTINQNAIDGLNFGTVNKVFLLFDTPIPEAFGNIVNLLWYEQDLQTLRQSKHAWTEAVGYFYRVDSKPHVLCAWLNGVEGRQAELLSDDAIKEGLLYLLSLFGKNYNFGNVHAVLRSKWSSERFIRGSYSSRSIATEHLQTGAADLGESLTATDDLPVVLFAGEATSVKHYSTVHGAIESGQREANRLINLYE